MAQRGWTEDELIDQLSEQHQFLRASAQGFDAGFEAEAKRLALTIRILVHDTAASHSLLGQIGIKDTIPFLDTASRIDPRNIVSTQGLTAIQVGPDGTKHVAMLGDRPGGRSRAVEFSSWWETGVVKDATDEIFTRRDLVLGLANKDGGAHVAPSLPARLAALTREGSLGWAASDDAGNVSPLLHNVVLPSVRQVAFEVDQTIARWATETGRWESAGSDDG